MDPKSVRLQGLDKFYTRDDVATTCLLELYSKFPSSYFDLTIEPSAGNGVFLEKIIGKKIGLDIAPEHKDIISMDFFDYDPEPGLKILVVGNPPFGKCSSLAIKFFNHSSKFADIIAFIVPRTFRRTSVQNRLNLNFELVYDTELPINPCCFTSKISVKCCFQLWKRCETLRKRVKLPLSHAHWEFLKLGPDDIHGQPTPPTGADFAIRAYGTGCGEIRITGLENLRPKSWHFIKSLITKEELISNFNLDYSISLDTARQNSIGRADLVYLYTLKTGIQ